MSEIGDNGGPPTVPLTAKSKLECIRSIIERDDLSSAQKCVGAKVVLEADREWTAEVKTGDLQRAASVKDRETVFRATRRLDELGIVAKASQRGQGGKFTVLAPRVVHAVIEALDELQSGRVEADQSKEKESGETGRDNQSVPTTHAVGFEPTTQTESGPVEPDRSGQTRPVPSDQSVKTRPVEPDLLAHAYKELPSEVVISRSLSEEREEKEGSAGAGTLALSVFNSYNEVAQRVGLPMASGLTPSRRRSIAARLREHGGYSAWESVLSNIERSAFLQGRNDRRWRPPGLAWFLNPDNFAKVLEGAYGNGAHAPSRPVSTQRILDENERILASEGWETSNPGIVRE